MILQVFTLEDKNNLIEKGFRFICENQLGDITVYSFEQNKLRFESLKNMKYKLTNKLYF